MSYLSTGDSTPLNDFYSTSFICDHVGHNPTLTTHKHTNECNTQSTCILQSCTLVRNNKNEQQDSFDAIFADNLTAVTKLKTTTLVVNSVTFSHIN